MTIWTGHGITVIFLIFLQYVCLKQIFAMSFDHPAMQDGPFFCPGLHSGVLEFRFS